MAERVEEVQAIASGDEARDDQFEGEAISGLPFQASQGTMAGVVVGGLSSYSFGGSAPNNHFTK